MPTEGGGAGCREDGQRLGMELMLHSDSLCSHRAEFVHTELLSLPAGYLLALCTASQGASDWGTTAGRKMGGPVRCPQDSTVEPSPEWVTV